MVQLIKMTDRTLKKIEHQIEKIKKELIEIGEMRPGSLTKQYKKSKDKQWEFYQISYTHKMKSKTEYVRPQHVETLQRQIKTYKRFKELIETWIDLSIEHSKKTMELANKDQLK
ncbi:MAG TPA: DUF6788 family protein [Dissulfurispiraceae bacterium]|nr:DUF6788 family protein [Dissulfurispiraceae bacterium]